MRERSKPERALVLPLILALVLALILPLILALVLPLTTSAGRWSTVAHGITDGSRSGTNCCATDRPGGCSHGTIGEHWHSAGDRATHGAGDYRLIEPRRPL